ncbi:hypothetical protein Dda3937_04531 [Dickeya dadantii 3937]|uniref:Transposase n=1 Tax=Dickeya dadantii (strain 3937) TaxID=198628 RepID=E0SJC0_DICD3|nr:hypothetical protein Dda3937_04531 [Dickeya dadantii 3937]
MHRDYPVADFYHRAVRRENAKTAAVTGCGPRLAGLTLRQLATATVKWPPAAAAHHAKHRPILLFPRFAGTIP